VTDKPNRIHPSIRARARELRQPQTPAERVLWSRLRNRQIGPKFRRQHLNGRYIVDFYCAEVRLAIEIDGESHVDQVEYDAERTAWLAQEGCRVIRFTNRQVYQQIDDVLAAILSVCQGQSDIEQDQPL